MNFEHGLQHLDVKPHNLFLVVSNHVKVADFGLVNRLPERTPRRRPSATAALTPLYASPEILQGTLSRHSDQYSLAIVYQQLLTGTVPFWSANPYQLLMQHVAGTPDLTALPPADRPLIGRALAKSPEQRFPSCMELVRALMQVTDAGGEVVRAAPRPTPAAPSLPAATRVLPSALQQNQATVPSAGPPAAPSLVLGQFAAEAPAADAPGSPAPVADAPGSPSADDSLILPQPSGVSLPGYRFLSCVGRSPFGCLWTVQDADGRERLADCLLSLGQIPADVRTRLQNLHHPALADREVFWVPPGCLVLVTDLGRQTLRDLFDECRTEGLQGVPREPLLNCLAAVAEALDELNRGEKLTHLTINPTQLLVEDGLVQLEGFGLAPLLWLPAGRPAAQLNPRYSCAGAARPRFQLRGRPVQPGPDLHGNAHGHLSAVEAAREQVGPGAPARHGRGRFGFGSASPPESAGTSLPFILPSPPPWGRG